MKKVFYYFMTSAIFALLFNTAGNLNQQAMLNPETGELENAGTGGFDLSNFGLGSLGLGNLGLGNLDLGSLGLGNIGNVAGACSGDTPLMLASGECISCDSAMKAKQNLDILMGCEQCPGLSKRGINCMVAMDTGAAATKNAKKSGKPSGKTAEPVKPVFTHQYSLVNIMGDDEKLRVTLQENATGRKKIIAVGDIIDGATVKAISLEGIIVEKNGVLKMLDVGI